MSRIISPTEAWDLLDATTPGPWSADDEHGLMPGACPAWVVSQGSDAGEFLGDLAYIPQSGTNVKAGPREQPNAELMAAAPDLAHTVIVLGNALERIEEALSRHPEPCTDTPYTCGWKHAVVDIHATLASVVTE